MQASISKFCMKFRIKYVSSCFHYYVMQVRHGFRSLLRTQGSRFPPQVCRHWNRTELVACATVRMLYPIRILAGAPESMMKILTFYSGLLDHCQDNYVTTILPSRLQLYFLTFVRPRPGKFFFHKTRARSQQIYSSVPFQFFLSSYIKLT